MTTIIDDNAVAEEIRDGLAGAIDALDKADVKPGFATVLMSDDPASETYVSVKQRDCEEVGIEAFDYKPDPETPVDEPYSFVDDLSNDDEVHDTLVQMPTPDHVDDRTALRHIDPVRDVDDFHPEGVGCLIAGGVRFKPCTPHGVRKLLTVTGVETEGVGVVVVGRSDTVGKSVANLFIQKAEGSNATVTVCHPRTDDLIAKTREADIVVAAADVPELVIGDMLSEDVVVVDVNVNRVDADNKKGYEFVGNTEFDSAREKASIITPVPSGVGPTARAMLLWNTAKAAAKAEGVDVDLP